MVQEKPKRAERWRLPADKQEVVLHEVRSEGHITLSTAALLLDACLLGSVDGAAGPPFSEHNSKSEGAGSGFGSVFHILEVPSKTPTTVYWLEVWIHLRLEYLIPQETGPVCLINLQCYSLFRASSSSMFTCRNFDKETTCQWPLPSELEKLKFAQ